MRSPQLENLERIARVAGGAYDRPEAAAVIAEEVYDLLNEVDCAPCDQVFLLSPLREQGRLPASQAVYVEAVAPPWGSGGHLRVGDIWDLGERAAHLFDRPFDHSDAAREEGLPAQGRPVPRSFSEGASSPEPYVTFDRYLRDAGLTNWLGLPLRAVGHDRPLGLLGVASCGTGREGGLPAHLLETIASAVAGALRLRRSCELRVASGEQRQTADDVRSLLATRNSALATVVTVSQMSDALRMQALTNMAFGISHSLANIFCAILGNLQSLSERVAEVGLEASRTVSPALGKGEAAGQALRWGTATAKGKRPTAAELVAKLEESTYAGIDMMRSLQKFAGQPPHELELVDLSELAREIVGLTEQLAAACGESWGIVLGADLSGPPSPRLPPSSRFAGLRGMKPRTGQELRPTLAEPDGSGQSAPAWCSRGQIHEAVIALVFNAIHATGARAETAGKGVTTDGEGGEITIITRVEAQQGGLPAYSRISVRDNGSGMTKEVQRRATEPFFTTEPETHQGLGLSIARGIVVAHGGQLTIQSRPGEGTQVDIRLPQSPPRPPSGLADPEEVISDVLSDLESTRRK